jgi:hypothetical protein
MKINGEITKVKSRDTAVRQENVRRNVGGTSCTTVQDGGEWSASRSGR